MSNRDKRSSKPIDYKKLHASGTTMPNSDYLSGDELDMSQHMAKDSSKPMMTPAQRDQDKFIANITSELQTLSLEEEELRLSLQLVTKRKSVENLKRHLAEGQSCERSTHITASESGYGHGTATHATTQMRADLNPQIYLRNFVPEAKLGKYRKILDFLPKRSRQCDEEIDIGEGLIFRLKSGTARLKVENVSPTQWIVANSNILGEILSSECRGMDSGHMAMFVADYSSYSAKIGELGCRFTWSSVMLYDDEYRELQAVHGFRWGSDAGHLTTVILREREVKKTGSNNSHSQSRISKSSGEDRTCGFYNSGGHCKFEPNCRFAHVCELCGKNHPKVSCGNDDKGSRTTWPVKSSGKSE